MLKKDYLQRKIEEFGKALSELVSKKHQLDFERELKILTMLYLNKDLEAIELLKDDSFVQRFLSDPTSDRTELKLSADALYETLLYRLETQKATDQSSLMKKCVLLYTFLLKEHTENEYDLGIHYRLKMLEKFQEKS